MASNPDRATTLREDAWNSALTLFGTARLFERRADSLKARLTWLKVVGLVLPLLVGGAVATFGTASTWLGPLLVVTGILGVAQLVMNGVALAMNWEDAYANAKEAQLHNMRLSDEYKKFAERASSDPSEAERLQYERQLDLLGVEKLFREQTDLRSSSISDKEKRFGMRSALHQFDRKCAGCQKVPDPRNPSSCVVCGA